MSESFPVAANLVVRMTRRTGSPESTICGFLTYIDDELQYVTFGFLVPAEFGDKRSACFKRSKFDLIVKNPGWDRIENAYMQYIEETGEIESLLYFPDDMSRADRAEFRKATVDKRYDVYIAIAHFAFVTEKFTLSPKRAEQPENEWILHDFMRLSSIRQSIATDNALPFSSIIGGIQADTYIMIIEPMTVNEFNNINDITYPIWRSKYAQQLLLLRPKSGLRTDIGRYIAPNIDIDAFEGIAARTRFARDAAIRKVTRKIMDNTGESRDYVSTVQRASYNIQLAECALITFDRSIYRTLLHLPDINDDIAKSLLITWFNYCIIANDNGFIYGGVDCLTLYAYRDIKSSAIIIRDRKFELPGLFRGTIAVTQNVIYVSRIENYDEPAYIRDQARLMISYHDKLRPRDERLNRIAEHNITKAFYILSLLDPISICGAIRSCITNKYMIDMADTIISICDDRISALINDESNVHPSSAWPIIDILFSIFSTI